MVDWDGIRNWAVSAGALHSTAFRPGLTGASEVTPAVIFVCDGKSHELVSSAVVTRYDETLTLVGPEAVQVLSDVEIDVTNRHGYTECIGVRVNRLYLDGVRFIKSLIVSQLTGVKRISWSDEIKESRP